MDMDCFGRHSIMYSFYHYRYSQLDMDRTEHLLQCHNIQLLCIKTSKTKEGKKANMENKILASYNEQIPNVYYYREYQPGIIVSQFSKIRRV